MSVRVMSQVWDLALPAFEKLVLLALADCANDEGQAWPSISTLKRKSGAGERTIYRAIASMETLGVLTIWRTYGKSNRYLITPATQAPLPHRHPCQSGTLPLPVRQNTPATQAPNPSKNHKEPSRVKSAASADTVLPSDILEGWNDLAAAFGLPKAQKMTGARLKQAKARLREYPDPEAWKRALRHIRETPFLRGENDSGWTANLDFLLQAKSFTKLTEESYGKAH